MDKNVDWDMVKVSYVTSDKSVVVLAQEYGISVGLIGTRSSAENWVLLRERYRRRRAKSVMLAVESDQLKKMKEHLKICDAGINAFVKQLMGKVVKVCPHCGGNVEITLPKTKITASDVNNLIKTRTQLAEVVNRFEGKETQIVLPSGKSLSEMSTDEIKQLAENAEIEIVDE